MSPATATNIPRLQLLGHEGMLTAQQEAALAEFRSALEEAGLYTPSESSTGRRPSHSDTDLLRYLRARNFNATQAMKQFSAADTWFKDMDLANLYPIFPVDEFTTAQKVYPMWIGRRDKLGFPIHVFRLAALNSKRMADMNSVSQERRYQKISVLYQLLMQGTLPLCAMLPSEASPTPPDGTTTLVDLEGVSFSLIWGLRSHLQQASVLANANFPETMGITFVVNAPSFFSTIWGWLKGWFDEHTRRKIHILSKSDLHALLSHIDAESLPKSFGGKLEWAFGDPPDLDEPAREAMKATGGKIPLGPWAMIDGRPYLGKDILEARKTLAHPATSAILVAGADVKSGENGSPIPNTPM